MASHKGPALPFLATLLTGTPLGFLLTGQSSPKDCTSSSPCLTLLVGNPHFPNLALWHVFPTALHMQTRPRVII